jgi:hypothetical protein
MAIEHELKRIADSLEQLVGFLGQYARPPLMKAPTELGELDAGVPTDAFLTGGPAPAPRAVDANLAFISGRWKRRQGDVIHAPRPNVPQVDPHARIDPYFEPIPATREEGSYGQATIIDRE